MCQNKLKTTEELIKELDSVKLVYNNLLQDVLSFYEIISKKNSTYEVLTLILRLARTIVDFSTAIILDNNYKIIHSINLNDQFKNLFNNSYSSNHYKEILLESRIFTDKVNESLSRIILPISTKKYNIGLIDIIVDLPLKEIKQEDLDLLWVLCSISAIEYESIDMSNRSNLLALLLTSLEKINSEDNLDKLLELILSNLRQLVPASNYLLILTDKLIEFSNHSKFCISEIMAQKKDCPIINEIIEKKNTKFIDKISNELICSSCFENPTCKQFDGSLMLVPLYKAELCFGVICIFDKDLTGEVFTSYNRHIIQIFAKQATIAINNAIIYDQQKKINRELAQVNQKLSRKNIELDAKRSEVMLHQEKLQKAHDELSKWNLIIKKELESAGIVQSAILSKTDKPESLNYHIEYKPHHSIGGDFFGIVTIDDTQTIIYIGDVSGKGVPAAIATGYLKNEFNFIINKLKLSDELSPGKILTEVNSSAINVFKYTEQFTSAWCGIVNNKEQKIIYASAGHDYPLLISDNVNFIEDNNGPIIGLLDKISYKDKEIPFHYPTKLVLYTDGVTDQEMKPGKRLGKNWLIDQIVLLKDETPEIICNTLVNEVIKNAKGDTQHDDILVIVLSLKNN